MGRAAEPRSFAFPGGAWERGFELENRELTLGG